MGALSQANYYFDKNIRVLGKNNRDGTFLLEVIVAEKVCLYSKEYDDEVAFNADLRSIRSKFFALDDFFKELRNG